MNKEKNGRLFVPAWCTRGISIAIALALIVLWIRSIVKRRKMKKALKAENPELQEESSETSGFIK